MIIGALTVSSVVFGDYFNGSILVAPVHDVIGQLGEEYHGVMAFVLHAFKSPAVYLAGAGVVTAWVFYLLAPEIPALLHDKLGFLHRLLSNKYGIDDFNQAVFAGGTLGIGRALWRVGDIGIIDGALVNGSAKGVGALASIARFLQSGYLFHYAFAMILGLLAMMSWLLFT